MNGYLRSCEYTRGHGTGWVKGYFHRFIFDSENLVEAVIENIDGTVDVIKSDNIRFTDDGSRFVKTSV